MLHLPDLSPIFYLAVFGVVCAFLLLTVGGSWVAYHLVQALRLYLGW